MLLDSGLYMIYRDGPGYLGGWLGLSDAEICARLAPGSLVMDWTSATGRCQDMIERSFRGFSMALHLTLCTIALHFTWKFAKSIVLYIHSTRGKKNVQSVQSVSPIQLPWLPYVSYVMPSLPPSMAVTQRCAQLQWERGPGTGTHCAQCISRFRLASNSDHATEQQIQLGRDAIVGHGTHDLHDFDKGSEHDVNFQHGTIGNL